MGRKGGLSVAVNCSLAVTIGETTWIASSLIQLTIFYIQIAGQLKFILPYAHYYVYTV
jgi:hypothetical protein